MASVHNESSDLVGSDSIMKAADIVNKMLDNKYDLGRVDCLSFILDFFEAKGIDMPTEWHGWTRDNYAGRWEQGEGREELYLFIHELGKEVEINYMLENDIVLIDTSEGVSTAIYLGNDNILMITIDNGLFVMPLIGLRKRIREVRRLG